MCRALAVLRTPNRQKALLTFLNDTSLARRWQFFGWGPYITNISSSCTKLPAYILSGPLLLETETLALPPVETPLPSILCGACQTSAVPFALIILIIAIPIFILSFFLAPSPFHALETGKTCQRACSNHSAMMFHSLTHYLVERLKPMMGATIQYLNRVHTQLVLSADKFASYYLFR